MSMREGLTEGGKRQRIKCRGSSNDARQEAEPQETDLGESG